jgi:hypothetical protein
MKNPMNLALQNHRRLEVLAALIGSVLLVGCAPKLHGEEFIKDGQVTSVGKISQAQCANGAKEDAMLYEQNFKGVELNSLGQVKLDLILKGTPTGESVHVYLNMPHDLVAERQAAVARYLKTAGVPETRIIVAEGPNPNNQTPTAYNMSGLYKSDGSAVNNGTSAPVVGSSSSAGAAH